ncbi:MAG: sugar phosphate isomerase/epimerase, partial [Lentisphaeria bacterium]|nr:sugar phosphate isomerase/epimerase [Lentisphaeria bacterium]
MSHPVTIFTGQWADLPLAELAPKIASFGYDGLELACWGDHMDVFKAAEDKKYCKAQLKVLEKSGLKCWAISNHLAGQLVCDPNNDSRSDGFGMVPKKCNGKPEAKREWAVESMKASAKAAKNLGISVVNGFTGSSIWHMLYSFPPVSDKMVDDGFKYFAKMWNPILDEFDKYSIKFALEVHP